MLRLPRGSANLSEYLISRGCTRITTNESQNWDWHHHELRRLAGYPGTLR